MDEFNKEVCKLYKNIDEQIEYLKMFKKIIINENERYILEDRNYISVINPYKEFFATNQIVKNIEGYTKKIHIYEEFQLYNLTHSTSDTAELTFERDGKEHTIQMEKRQFGDETTKRMGFTYSAEVEKPGFFKSIQYGAYTAKYWVEYTLECLKMLLTGEVGVNQLSGPVGIVEVVNDTYDAAAPSGWSVVILSMMNLGILIFLLIEAVRRKRIAPEKEGMVHFIGFAALMALMVFVMYNDIMRLF